MRRRARCQQRMCRAAQPPRSLASLLPGRQPQVFSSLYVMFPLSGAELFSLSLAFAVTSFV